LKKKLTQRNGSAASQSFLADDRRAFAATWWTLAAANESVRPRDVRADEANQLIPSRN